MTMATRNQLIKKVLTKQFGTGKVTVRGSRGSAYGWVTVKIDYTPKDRDHREAITRVIWKLFEANKIEIGTYGYNDPGSDYGMGREIHFDFNPCLKSEYTGGAYA